MNVKEHVALAPYTTLRIGGNARFFIAAHTEADVEEGVRFAKEKNLPVFVLGGGSNVVLPDEVFSAVVIRMCIEGREIIEEEQDSVIIEVGAGEHLDTFIAWTVQEKLWGLENLSLIPGTAAGLAVQNAGAYGVEASQRIVSVHAYDLKEEKFVTLENSACDFGYRSSRFNTADKGQFIITKLRLRLSQVPQPVLSYRGVQERVGSNTSQEHIRAVIMDIRKEKDLDPDRVWSVGSFFKNVEMEEEVYKRMRNSLSEEHQIFLDARVFQTQNGYKIPSAALIDMLGLKHTRVGGAHISAVQANMIVSTQGATSDDVQKLFKQVVGEVEKATGIILQNEPEFISGK